MAFNNLPVREEYLKKKRKRKLIRRGATLFLFIFIVGVFSYVAHRPEIRISKVELMGGVLVTEEEIQEETLSFLDGSYFWLAPKNNSFLYPHNKLGNYLKDSFKRIDTIEIVLKD